MKKILNWIGNTKIAQFFNRKKALTKEQEVDTVKKLTDVDVKEIIELRKDEFHESMRIVIDKGVVGYIEGKKEIRQQSEKIEKNTGNER